jgi:hypothetical protein
MRQRTRSPGSDWLQSDPASLNESADKPGSVVGNHSSKDRCHQRPQATYPEARGATVRSLRNAASLFGLAPGGVYRCRDVLPPARCALTAPFHPYRDPWNDPGILRRLFSVALSVGSRLPGVTWHPARRSPDFPPACKHASDCLADSRGHDSLSAPPTARIAVRWHSTRVPRILRRLH